MNMMRPGPITPAPLAISTGSKGLTAFAVAGRKAVRRKGAEQPVIPGIIDSWTDLGPGRRGDLKTAVGLLARASGKDLAQIPFTAKSVRDILDLTTPAALELSDTSFAAYVGHLRYILRRLDLLKERRRAGHELRPAWAPLIDTLTDKIAWLRLKAFVAFCSDRGLDPVVVNDAVLADYLAHLQVSDVRGSARDTVRRVAKGWNHAAETVPGWPGTRLTPPASEPRQYSLPFDAFPPSLQEDVASFEARLRRGKGESLFAEDRDGPKDPLRAASIRTRMVGLRLALAALVHSGTPPGAITRLAMLVEIEHLKEILIWHWRRAGERKGAQLGILVDTLRVVAKYHARLEGDALHKVLDLLREAKPKRQVRMTARNMKLLAEFEDERRRAAMLHLPRHLLRIAERQRSGWIDARGQEHPPRALDAARTAALAVAVEIELHCPIRIENLTNLRCGHDLVRLDGRARGYTHVRISADDVKNDVAIEWALDSDTRQVLGEFVNHYRPLLPNANSDWLFPSKTYDDRPRNKGSLGNAISLAIHRNVGVRMSTHQFRALAGALILGENPHAIEDLRLVLGHTTFDTSMRFYASWAPKGAVARLSKVITTERRRTRLIADAAFAKRNREAPPPLPPGVGGRTRRRGR
jgi:integrase